MFPEGSKEPYEHMRRLIERLAGPLKATPFRISITGHTSATNSRRGLAMGRGNSPPTGRTRFASSSKQVGYPRAFLHGCWQGRHAAAFSR